MVNSVPDPGLLPRHRTRDSAAFTLGTSAVLLRVYVAVHVVAVAESYWSDPSRGARRSRRPLKPNLSLLIRRCSIWSRGICTPLGTPFRSSCWAVPLMVTFSPDTTG